MSRSETTEGEDLPRQLLAEIRPRLQALADPETRKKVERSVPGAKILGVKVPELRELAKVLRARHRQMILDEACDLMDELCKERIREEILVGIFLLGRFGKRIEELPWSRLEGWLEAIDNWETCDQLASNVAGRIAGAHLEVVDRLIELTAAENPWIRRFALATASDLNHHGRSFPQQTLRVCEPLLDDPARTVSMAVGWAIREASKKDGEAVFEFLRLHRDAMPRRVLREASAKLAPEWKQELLS